MRLFHGSNIRISDVDLSFSRLYKDFGAGFYLTPDYARAVRMATRCAELEQTGSPEVNSFIFNRKQSEAHLNIKEFKHNDWEWAKFVMLCRDKSHTPPFTHDYDVVIGPVADSSVDPIIEEYREEYGKDYLVPENLKILAAQLRYSGSPYIQYCFCTDTSLNFLFPD
ncbi:MAG: DUF3990 domain-containing protein [Duncaniella sp.]|nr:DUF3990 domain-containing protein [Duncaniella sp.]